MASRLSPVQPRPSSVDSRTTSPADDLRERSRALSLMFSRYPTTRLDQPELTLEAYIADTAHLPLDELRDCITFACAASPTFVPTSPALLDAFSARRGARIQIVPVGNPCTLEELRLTAEHRARATLRQLREHHIERTQIGPLSSMVDGLLASMSSRPKS